MLDYNIMPTTPTRTIKAKVEHYNSSTLANTFRYSDNLISVDVDRVGEEAKFFGFGIVQKTTVKIRDVNRQFTLSIGDYLLLHFGLDDEEIELNTNQPYFPQFYIEDIKRDENTNELTIEAYDKLYKATEYKTESLKLNAEYEMQTVVGMMASSMGLSLDVEQAPNFYLYFENGANLEGTETALEVFNAAAEASQTIYFVKNLYGVETLVFKQLDFIGLPVLTIGKESYFELTTEESRTLTAIASTTQLGDNYIAGDETAGETQYIKDNMFLELREDIAELLEYFISSVYGATITPFSCKWRGNFYTECGDKIAITTKDGGTVESFIINDSFSYNGGFTQKTAWSYEAIESGNNNPTTIGEALKETFAKVDKANKRIELVASETAANTEELSTLKLDTESISGTVQKIEEAVAGVNDNVDKLSQQVSLAITAEQLKVEVSNQLQNGVESIKTGKGFTFDDNGLTVEDISDTTNNAIKTTVSNNGMAVAASNTEVLVANDSGVKARNLHANTYLIIGKNSRFEDYGNNRTACFWIGG